MSIIKNNILDRANYDVDDESRRVTTFSSFRLGTSNTYPLIQLCAWVKGDYNGFSQKIYIRDKDHLGDVIYDEVIDGVTYHRNYYPFYAKENWDGIGLFDIESNSLIVLDNASHGGDVTYGVTASDWRYATGSSLNSLFLIMLSDGGIQPWALNDSINSAYTLQITKTTPAGVSTTYLIRLSYNLTSATPIASSFTDREGNTYTCQRGTAISEMLNGELIRGRRPAYDMFADGAPIMTRVIERTYNNGDKYHTLNIFACDVNNKPHPAWIDGYNPSKSFPPFARFNTNDASITLEYHNGVFIKADPSKYYGVQYTQNRWRLYQYSMPEIIMPEMYIALGNLVDWNMPATNSRRARLNYLGVTCSINFSGQLVEMFSVDINADGAFNNNTSTVDGFGATCSDATKAIVRESKKLDGTMFDWGNAGLGQARDYESWSDAVYSIINSSRINNTEVNAIIKAAVIGNGDYISNLGDFGMDSSAIQITYNDPTSEVERDRFRIYLRNDKITWNSVEYSIVPAVKSDGISSWSNWYIRPNAVTRGGVGLVFGYKNADGTYLAFSNAYQHIALAIFEITSCDSNGNVVRYSQHAKLTSNGVYHVDYYPDDEYDDTAWTYTSGASFLQSYMLTQNNSESRKVAFLYSPTNNDTRDEIRCTHINSDEFIELEQSSTVIVGIYNNKSAIITSLTNISIPVAGTNNSAQTTRVYKDGFRGTIFDIEKSNTSNRHYICINPYNPATQVNNNGISNVDILFKRYTTGYNNLDSLTDGLNSSYPITDYYFAARIKDAAGDDIIASAQFITVNNSTNTWQADITIDGNSISATIVFIREYYRYFIDPTPEKTNNRNIFKLNISVSDGLKSMKIIDCSIIMY